MQAGILSLFIPGGSTASEGAALPLTGVGQGGLPEGADLFNPLVDLKMQEIMGSALTGTAQGQLVTGVPSALPVPKLLAAFLQRLAPATEGQDLPQNALSLAAQALAQLLQSGESPVLPPVSPSAPVKVLLLTPPAEVTPQVLQEALTPEDINALAGLLGVPPQQLPQVVTELTAKADWAGLLAARAQQTGMATETAESLSKKLAAILAPLPAAEFALPQVPAEIVDFGAMLQQIQESGTPVLLVFTPPAPENVTAAPLAELAQVVPSPTPAMLDKKLQSTVSHPALEAAATPPQGMVSEAIMNAMVLPGIPQPVISSAAENTARQEPAPLAVLAEMFAEAPATPLPGTQVGAPSLQGQEKELAQRGVLFPQLAAKAQDKIGKAQGGAAGEPDTRNPLLAGFSPVGTVITAPAPKVAAGESFGPAFLNRLENLPVSGDAPLTGLDSGSTLAAPAVSTGAGHPNAPEREHAMGSRASHAPFTQFMDDQAPVREQVLVQLQRSLENGQREVRIQMEPAELGRVHIHMELSKNGHTHLAISADNPETLQLLQRDARQLAQSLNDLGLQASPEQMSFNLQEQGGQGQQYAEDGGFGQRGDAQSGQEETGMNPASNGGRNMYQTLLVNLDDGVNIQV